MASVRCTTPPPSRADRAPLRAVVVRALRRIHQRATYARALVETDVEAAVELAGEIGELVIVGLEQVRRLVDDLARAAPARRALTDEIHDSLGHDLSLAAVLAGTARVTALRDPRRAADALDQIVDLTARATDELTARLDRPDAPPTAVDLRSLAAQVRADPTPPVVRIEEQALTLAAEPVMACAGGIVRESLTNARRHAPGAPVGVGISIRGSELLVIVTNTRPTTPRPSGGRRGIAGMHRRAHAVGGRVHAGATPSGGFLVQACLPLSTSPSPTPKDPR